MLNTAKLRNTILSTVVLAGMLTLPGVADARRSRPKPNPQPTTQPVKADKTRPVNLITMYCHYLGRRITARLKVVMIPNNAVPGRS